MVNLLGVLFLVFLFFGLWKLVRWPLKFFLLCLALMTLSTCATSVVGGRRSAADSGVNPPPSSAPSNATLLPDSLRDAALGR